MKTLDLKNYKLQGLDASEQILLNGGGTDFAYDVGILCRFTLQQMTKNYGGMAMTIYKWGLANVKK